jgi:hypothetical protein
MSRLRLTLSVTAALLCLTLGTAHAAPFTVDAFANNSSSGGGVSTVSLGAGQWFSVTADPGDLWNAGPLPRWSNADGLTYDLFATGSDDSGQPFGTLIGQDFGLHTQDSFSAPYGTLMGKLGTTWMVLGTSFAGTAPVAGTLELFYWDSYSDDNTEHITADVVTRSGGSTPELSTWLLLGCSGLAGVALRRRRRA